MNDVGSGRDRHHWRWRGPWLALAAMIAGYMGLFGWLSLARHAALDTHALDLGYVTQAMWNTAHGRPFQFTTFEGARYVLDIPFQRMQRQDQLLGYHVEPLLALLSPLLLIWPDARALLLLQTAGLAAGAVPAYVLARRRLGHAWLALAFPALYLLAPSLQAANLSDFHAVAFSPALLLAAFLAVELRRWRCFAACALLALLCKEEIALLVLMLGLYAAWRGRPRWIGLATAGVALAWFLLATLVIIPAINGIGGSPFLARYQQFGGSAAEIAGNILRSPGRLAPWLTRPAAWRYLLLLLGSGGGVVICGPAGWVAALPVVVANLLSGYDWMASGGGHYSASVVGLLVAGAIEGTLWLRRRWPASRRSPLAPIVLGALAIGVATQCWAGATPLSSRWTPPRVSAHDRLAGALMATIPADASVIAQSALYPHLATRRRAILFPSAAEADFVVLDVTGASYPISKPEYEAAFAAALARPGYQVRTAQDGIVILQRGAGAGAPLDETAFASFALAGSAPAVSAPAELRRGLVFEGYTARRELVVTTRQPPWRIVTYWHVTRPQAERYRLALYFTRADGALAWAYADGTPTDTWFPTTLWPAGTRIQATFPAQELDDFQSVLLGVVREGGDAWSAAGRLPIVAAGVPTLDAGTLLPLFDLR